MVAAIALAVAVGVGAAPARAAYGLLDHYEICASHGEYASLTSLSVRQNVYVGDYDGVVRVLTQGGTLIQRIEGTGLPDGTFSDPIVGTSSAGTLYVISDPIGSDPRLFKFSGGAFEREFPKDQGPLGLAPRLSNSVGLIAGQPARDGAPEEVFVADAEGIVAWDSNGNFTELYTGPFGNKGGVRFVGIAGTVTTGTPGISAPVLGLGLTSDSEQPSELSLLVPGANGIRFVDSFNVVPFLSGVAGAPDGTWWVVGGSLPGFAGLEHYSIGGGLLDRIPIPGGASAVSVAPDGAVWVIRQDGLLRLGQNGGPIPPDQYGHKKCGAPAVRPSVPATQQIDRTRKLVIAARCNEACTLRASGTLSVPNAARTFRLHPATRHVAAGRQARLGLGLSRSAVTAIHRAHRRHLTSSATITLVAVDAGDAASARRFRLTIR